MVGHPLEDVVGGRDNLPIDLRLMQDGVEANPLVRSISKETDILHLAGPTSQKVLAALNPAAGEIPFLGMAEVEIGGVACKVFRITFTGCMVRQLRHHLGPFWCSFSAPPPPPHAPCAPAQLGAHADRVLIGA